MGYSTIWTVILMHSHQHRHFNFLVPFFLATLALCTAFHAAMRSDPVSNPIAATFSFFTFTLLHFLKINYFVVFAPFLYKILWKWNFLFSETDIELCTNKNVSASTRICIYKAQLMWYWNFRAHYLIQCIDLHKDFEISSLKNLVWWTGIFVRAGIWTRIWSRRSMRRCTQG